MVVTLFGKMYEGQLGFEGNFRDKSRKQKYFCQRWTRSFRLYMPLTLGKWQMPLTEASGKLD